MGVIGTGVAAGVAQTALQAQQVSQRRNKRVADNTRVAQRMRELAEVRLRGLEEQDAGDDPNRIHIDSQVPEHEHHDHRPGASGAVQLRRRRLPAHRRKNTHPQARCGRVGQFQVPSFRFQVVKREEARIAKT